MGILWNEIEGNLVFRLEDIFKDATVTRTKRNILSVISTVYDLMGYLQPFTKQLKILFQKICKLNIDWDDSIGELIVEWKICENLKRCEEIVFKRYYIYDLSEKLYLLSEKRNLFTWVFGGFAISLCSIACIYLQSVTQSGNAS